MVFHLYESLCSQHVLSQQMDHKLIRKLTRRNPAAAVSENTRLAAEEHFSRSSLIGKDPYGDLARPAPEREGPLLPTAGPAQADGTVAAAVRGPGTYSSLQLLMMEIQDKTHLYLTVHIKKLLSPSVYLWVREEEIRYENNENGIRDNTPRQRMTWGRYKEVVLLRLSELIIEFTRLPEGM